MSQAAGGVLARRAALLAAAAFPLLAAASDSPVHDLEQRLSIDGADEVNAYLGSHWSSAMEPLNRRVVACDLQAVSLAIRLGRSSNARAVEAHGESIRAAAGSCTRFVLALVSLEEIPRYCASVASWGAAQTARELRRRIAAIESDGVLRTAQRGKACQAAYVHELQNTRVVLRSATPSASRQGH